MAKILNKYNAFSLFLPVLGMAVIFSYVALFPIHIHAATTTSCIQLQNTLKVGSNDLSTHSEVSQLQNFLTAQGMYSYRITGTFGPITASALQKFQTSHSLYAAGVTGPLTRALIQKITCVQASTTAQTNTTTSNQTAAVIQAPVITPPASANASTNSQTSLSLPYTASAFGNEWQRTWGVLSTTTGTLVLKTSSPDAPTTGATAILKGSENWKDYSYTANANISNGNIILISRYNDPGNFIACAFANGRVAIQTFVGGAEDDVASIDFSPLPLQALSNSTVMISVQGNTITCSSGINQTVLYSVTTSVLQKGGIGIETWNSIAGIATLELREVSVKSL